MRIPEGRGADPGPPKQVEAPLILAITGLGPGGAERVLSGLADRWVARGREVTLVTWADRSGDHFHVDARVRRVELKGVSASRSLFDAVHNNLVRWRRLRRVLSGSGQPVVISFGESMNVLCILAALGTNARVIACERNDPRHHRIGPMWSLLRRLTYPLAAGLCVQTERVRAWADTIVRPERVVVIPNPVSDVPSPDRRSRQGDRCQVIAVGRLVDQKGFDILLRAFAEVATLAPQWDLAILGDGERRDDLTALAAELDILARVAFPGVVSDPGEHLASSHLFVLSSRYEGFPNALLEAMASGLPVISTDCPSGPSDIIRDGHDGILVPVDDPAALAQAMLELMEDASTREALGLAARSVLDRFSPELVMRRWDAAIAEVSSR